MYKNMLTETYLENDKIEDANCTFDETVVQDERNNCITFVNEISHRVLCNECLKENLWISRKMQKKECIQYDFCTLCLQFRGNRCGEHPRIQIPSPEAARWTRTLRRNTG